MAVADIDWVVAGLIALGSVVGGQIGARVGRRLPPALLRGVIAVVGIVALVVLLV
ncbi:MAG TPA: TSUP family transporter [Nocardioides sp.]|nr:TSUP family transporter [Nocardioides sp.]